MKFNKETILDPELIDLEGATMLLPEGWKREGGFKWMADFSTQANILMRVTDPETGASGQTLLTQNFVWVPPSSFFSPPLGSLYLGSVMLPPPRHPAEAVQMALMPGPLQHLRGAQLMWAVNLTEYNAEISRSVSHATVQATRLRYAFGGGGRGWEEDVYLTAAFTPPDVVYRWWCTAWSLRAPAGQLDRMTPLLASIMLSVRTTFDWSAMLDYAQMEYMLNIQRQQQARINTPPLLRTPDQRRGIIWANTETPGYMWMRRKDEIRTKYRLKWDGRQPSADRERIVMGRVIGGIETYSNPFDSSHVQLPSDYSVYWASKEGQVIGSNDDTFDPGAGNSAQWQRMTPYTPGP